MSENAMKGGLSEEDNSEATSLYDRHKAHADSLQRAQETLSRGDAMREIVKKAWGDGSINDIPREDQVFANGGTNQLSAVQESKLYHDANLWEAREHYLQNQEQYVEQAVQDAAAAGVEINLSEAAKKAADIVDEEVENGDV